MTASECWCLYLVLTYVLLRTCKCLGRVYHPNDPTVTVCLSRVNEPLGNAFEMLTWVSSAATSCRRCIMELTDLIENKLAGVCGKAGDRCRWCSQLDDLAVYSTR